MTAELPYAAPRTPEEESRARDRYSEGLFSHAIDGERQRLALLESLLDGHTRRRLTALGAGPGTDVLEVGGGGGSVARWLAGRGARVTVTDLDTRFLDELGELGVRVLRHDLCADDFPPESFDLVHTRYVVIHQAAPDRAVARLVRWLRPGGVLVLEEPASFSVMESPHPAYRKVMRDFRAHLERSIGSDTGWARTLPEPLRRAGLTGVGLDARIQVVHGGGTEALWWRMNLERSRAAMVAHGEVCHEDFEAAYEELASPGFHDLALTVMTAWGRRAG
ncbi:MULTISPECIES: methyltransferase domain-containing protein [unclassified Streptomyces]|uniref:methyltransferase domain-containing protein n=1 Tax=unclassified Streptomyces TaxID=2593676 RepID=UPI002E2B1862|nr:methyltransferase domain-containing protein [Streptomyces sp. NBC_01429]